MAERISPVWLHPLWRAFELADLEEIERGRRVKNPRGGPPIVFRDWLRNHSDDRAGDRPRP